MLAMAMAMARLSRSSYYAILFTEYLQLLFAVIGDARVRTSKMKGE